MADISFTATAIKPTTNTIQKTATLGEAAITQGMALYQKASDSKWYIADCTTSAATAAAEALALGAGGTDQRIQVATGGDITCDGLSLSVATADPVIVLSEAGAVAPSSDLAASDYITIIGVPLSATSLRLGFKVSGVAATA